MIHMLSAFDLKPQEDMQSFTAAYALFVKELTEADLIVSAGAIGQRVADTPMDTDDAREHGYFSILTFRDRDQLDAAYAHIDRRARPATGSHLDMYRRIINPVFLCWEDLPE